MSRRNLLAVLAATIACGGEMSTFDDDPVGDAGPPAPSDGAPPFADSGPPIPSEACGGGLCTTFVVQEALPGFETGIARHGEWVRVGLPLGIEHGVRSADDLSVQGAAAAQLRALETDDAGFVRWVQVDAVVDVPAGGETELRLTAGSGGHGGADLATDARAGFRIDTGVAVFAVDAEAGLHSAEVGGVERLRSPLALYGQRTREGATAAMGIDSLVLEENGPAKAVVRAEGTLADGEGTLVWFDARYMFVRGRADVRHEITFRNDTYDHYDAVRFHALGLRVGAEVGAAPRVALDTLDGERFEGAVGGGALAYQALPTGYPALDPAWSALGCYPVAPPVEGECDASNDFAPAYEGLRVTVGDGLDFPNERSLRGGVFVEGAAGALAVAYRWMPGYFPSSFAVDAEGGVDVGLWSPEHTGEPQELKWGAHDTREVVIDFAGADADSARAASFRVDYPLVGRAPFELYRSTGAFHGQTALLDADAQREALRTEGDAVPWQSRLDGDSFYVRRREHWRRHYFLNEQALLNFVRTGDASYWLHAYQDGQFESDYAYGHSRGFDLYEEAFERVGGSNVPGQLPYDSEHQITSYLPLLWHMTGDTRIREGIDDYAEYVLGRTARRYPRADGGFRSWLRWFENHAWLWELRRDERHLAEVREGVDFLIDTFTDEGLDQRGRDPERGYIYMYSNREIHNYFEVNLFGESMHHVLRILRETGVDHRVQELEDIALGHAMFIFREAAWSGDDMRWFGHYPAGDHPLDVAPQYTEDWRGPDGSGSLYVGGRWAQLLYDVLGDPTGLELSREVFRRRLERSAAGEQEAAQLQMQAVLAYDVERPTPRDGWQLVDVESEELGGGRVRLRWTVPEGARRYRIKTADRPIVEWLGFDQMSRTYEHDPSEAVPFFAATEVRDVPAPASGGSVQEHIVDADAGAHFVLAVSTR